MPKLGGTNGRNSIVDQDAAGCYTGANQFDDGAQSRMDGLPQYGDLRIAAR